MANLQQLQELQNNNVETLRKRLLNIENQKSGMTDFFKRAEPIVNEELTKRSYGTFASPNYSDVITNSLSNTRELSGLNEEQYSILDALTKAYGGMQDGARQDRQLALQEAQAGLSYNPETGQYNGGLAETEEDLMKKRKARVEQGLDTGDIDQKLKSMGVNIEALSSDKKQILSLLDELIDSNTNAITGLKNPLAYLGSRAKTENKFKQLKGMLTLENISKLKGTGTISDRESAILQQASTFLDTNLKNKDFKDGLKDLRKQLGGNTGTISTGLNYIIEEE